MTNKILKKLNGDYEKILIEQTFLHHIYLNSEDLCLIFDIEYDSTIQWTISYKERSMEHKVDGFVNLKATIGNKVLLDKQWEDSWNNTRRTRLEIKIINYVEHMLGYNEDCYHHYSKKVTLRNVHQQIATEELVLVSWRTIEAI